MEKLLPFQTSTSFIVILMVVTALLPIILAISKSKNAFELAALLLCLGSIIGVVATAVTGGVLSLFISLSFFGMAWCAGLICGIAALHNNLADKRIEDLTFRLLNADAEKLRVPKVLRSKYRNPNNGT